ncbi:hypothetical protein CBR_g52029 [Chara braunii]|uniref:Uncharacterized protein n=1 Tax=Chara braunii TaxID=69332 RepID=A0A388M998_CHABU|nr:hypothetical protein CBR_g52029 [Chara braunii]|eukprot:GBG91148.1 hypothetical protein CBR_g52029 [Chara braunii]
MTPSRRRIDYRGSDGWQSRILERSIAGAGVGAISGAAVAATRGQRIPPMTLQMASNFGIATICFCGAQELVRELRGDDGLANSFLGGLGSGALLGRIHGGSSRALPCAILFAAVGTALHWAALELKEYKMRRLMSAWPAERFTLDPSIVGGDGTAAAEELSRAGSLGSPQGAADHKWMMEQQKAEWKWPEWLPVRRLTEEEAREEERKRDEEFKRRVELAKRGAVRTAPDRQEAKPGA